MAPPALWTFSTPAAARAPHVMLIAFGVGPLAEDVPLSLSKFGLPSADHVGLLDVRTIGRAADPAWFDGWRSGALRTIASGDLGDGLAALDAADHAHVIAAEPEAPTDLGYLQAAWGMARHLVARGASVVLDVHAMTYRAGNRLPPADAGLGVARELRVVFESDSTHQDGAHALHTRGMRKFGAPDLVALCSPPDAQLVASVIERLADVVARGGVLAFPRHGVDLDERTTWYAVADEHGLAGLLGLNNDARILVDDHGHHLTGVLARLRTQRG